MWVCVYDIYVWCICKHARAHTHQHACECSSMWSGTGYASLILQHRPRLELNRFTVPSSWWEELIGTLRSPATQWMAQQNSLSPVCHKSAGRWHSLGEQYFCRKTAVWVWVKVFVKWGFLLKNEKALFWCFQSVVSITYSKTMFHYRI